jgi:hypothetical protein
MTEHSRTPGQHSSMFVASWASFSTMVGMVHGYGPRGRFPSPNPNPNPNPKFVPYYKYVYYSASIKYVHYVMTLLRIYNEPLNENSHYKLLKNS